MHLYIHVPFCARRCSYCDFAIAVRPQTPDDVFVRTIIGEWQQQIVEPGWLQTHVIKTVYFGGGTPSRLAASSIARLLESVRGDRVIAADAEITLESNPDDVTVESARAWVDAGVNRISLGVQSHDPAVLSWMHRTHRAEQVPEAVAILRDAGVRSISGDLIFAMPAEVSRDWSRDLALTLDLKLEHLSLYGLTVESRTPLDRWVQRGEVHAAPDERYAAEFLEAHAALTAAGFDHYEVSNYGRADHHARHNSAYWSGAAYLGLGPSAHSFRDGVRWWNVREWVEYADRASRGEPLEGGREQLDAAARALERRYLGLRTSRGITPELIPDAVAQQWRASGWAETIADRIVLTPEGWLRLDALVGALRDF